jgi:hypothetical protein
MKKTIILETIIAAMAAKNYVLYDTINLVGIRAENRVANSFDDALAVFWKEGDNYEFHCFKITTDPGNKSLVQPINSKGCAILVPGQYIDSHTLGLHKGKYEALVQINNMKVYRDINRDTMLDMNPKSIEEGLFGINIHHAAYDHESFNVEDWSAGCQVVPDPKIYDVFFEFCKKHKKKNGRFTYALLEEKDL